VDAPQVIEIEAGPVALGARRWPGDGARPVLLVHGLSSNARLWDEVAAQLAGAGHPVVAVDLRGHASSAAVPDPDDERGATRTAAADLAAVCATLGWAGDGATPDGRSGHGGVIVAGQSWGGNVVLQLAAEAPELVHGLVLVDGGWLHLIDRWPDLAAAWDVLAPPAFDGLTAVALRARLTAMHPDWSPGAIDATAANLREHPDGTVSPWLDRARHRSIVASMVAHRPRELYPQIRCRTVLLAATGSGMPGAGPLLDEALAALPHGELVEFPGADHDLHAQHPNRVAALIGSFS